MLNHSDFNEITLHVMNHRVVVNVLRICWVVIAIWYELGVFLNNANSCDWPDATFQTASPHAASTPSHVLLIADPQILDHRSYPERGPFLTYLSQLVVDLNLRKSWWAALRKHPDVVIFLGDMMDGGRIDMADDEYEGYYNRFKSIFRLPSTIPTYFIPGNHDIGLRASPIFSPHARARFRSHFGPLNSRVSVANHTLVLLDAPSLIEENSQRANARQTYQDWKPHSEGPVELVKTVANEHLTRPVVLFSHIPLARDSLDCGPLREKGTIRPGIGLGYQNTLGADVSSFLLETLHPSVIYSGDDHDYCETYHTYRNGEGTSQAREVSLKSLSMAMGIRRPGFQLLSLAGWKEGNLNGQKTLADVSCLLPDQIAIYLNTYIPLLILSLFIVFGSNAIRVRKHTAKRPRRPPSPRQQRSEDALERGWDEVSLLPRPVSARTSKFGPKQRIPTSIVVFGHRRRIVCFDIVRRCFTLSTSRRLDSESLWGGLLRDARDIAIFPLTLFVAISLWITWG